MEFLSFAQPLWATCVEVGSKACELRYAEPFPESRTTGRRALHGAQGPLGAREYILGFSLLGEGRASGQRAALLSPRTA
jgi:hypothetical protein